MRDLQPHLLLASHNIILAYLLIHNCCLQIDFHPAHDVPTLIAPAVSTLIRLGKLPSSGRQSALHDAATEATLDSLMNYANDWLRAPVASRRKQQKYLSALSQPEDLDVLRHLSINRELDELDALSIIEKTNDN